jgi:WD40 repeat protein
MGVSTLGTRDRSVRGVAFSRDGRHLATACSDGVVQLWDATRLGERQVPRHSLAARVHGPCLNVAFSPDGHRLVTGGQENTVQIWDVETGRELQTLRGHSGDVYTVAFAPGGRWVASAGEDSAVRVWDGNTGEIRHTFRGHTGLVSSLAFRPGPDGLRLITGSRDHTIKVWDVSRLEGEPER